MTKDNTYSMEFTCSNCGHSFSRDIPKGTKAKGQGGTCGYCGCVDTGNFQPGRPLWLQYAEYMRPMPMGGNDGL